MDKVPIKINRSMLEALRDGARLRGHIKVEVFDNAKDRNLISVREGHNLITNEGLDAILDIMLHGSTQITTWYCVLSETDTSPAAGMTYATPTFTEWDGYEGTRPQYVEAAASSQSITNSANKAEFTSNESATLYGAGLVGGGSAPSTKNDTAGGGTLFNFGEITDQPVVSGNVVNLTITISAADDGV